MVPLALTIVDVSPVTGAVATAVDPGAVPIAVLR